MEGTEPNTFKDIGLNDEITINLPGHIAFGFVEQFQVINWESPNAKYIVGQILRQIMTPLAISSIEANLAAQQAQEQAMRDQFVNSMLQGQNPGGIPPEFMQ